MNIKTILYICTTPIVIWMLEGLNIEKIFKKNKYNQIITFYLLSSLAVSYLIVNFLYDFFLNSKFI